MPTAQPPWLVRTPRSLIAANQLGVDLVIGSDGALPLGSRPVVHVNPSDPQRSADRLIAHSGPVSAVVAADTPMLVLAAAVAERMGLPHNPVEAVIATTDKARQRCQWALAAVAQPVFRIVPADAPEVSVRQAAADIGFPCVVKAVSLSASQGILASRQHGGRRGRSPADPVCPGRSPASPGELLLIEEYVPGRELSIDGLLTAGDLIVTAIFDKPCTPEGPTFEETVLTSPSRLPEPVLAAAIATAGQAARSLGLTHGPIHAELRIDERGGRVRPVMLELAARCIGGLCSRVLHFPGGITLEALVLASALGRTIPRYQATRPSGVLMLPIPRAGMLRAVEGRSDAAATPGITGLTITIPAGQHVQPLPEGDRYLGFIFAEGDTCESVEKALNAARNRLRIVIE